MIITVDTDKESLAGLRRAIALLQTIVDSKELRPQPVQFEPETPEKIVFDVPKLQPKVVQPFEAPKFEQRDYNKLDLPKMDKKPDKQDKPTTSKAPSVEVY